jgi:hypothetical protein
MRRRHRILLPPAGSRREADLFYADLIGEATPERQRRRIPPAAPPPPRYPAVLPVARRDERAADPSTETLSETYADSYADASDTYDSYADSYADPSTDAPTEAVPAGGRGAFRHEPLGGIAGDNVAARWNVDASTASGSTVDLVVHLHGYSSQADDARFLPRKTDAAGVDLVAGDGSVRVRASQPTLVLVPRGRHTDGATWLFDKLRDRAGLDALIDAALQWLCTTVLRLPSGSTLRRGRLTLAAHSGGGAGMNALLTGGVNPDELMCFDSMYGDADPIRRWAVARIGSADAARSGLRVFYTGCSADSWSYRNGQWRLTTTEISARRVHDAVQRALSQSSNAAALANRFRVQRTSVAHGEIPVRYSPLLLENVAADVPQTSAPPAATSRPACVANDDWLTQPPQRPGGTAPPAKPAEGEDVGEYVPALMEDTYAPPGARTYTPGTDATIFRTAPDPVGVTPATEWPQAAPDGDAATTGALRALGVAADRITAFGTAGMTALRPIASAFGQAALVELARRLRYSAARLAQAPHSYDREADLTRAFGRAVPRPAILAMRLLLAIPGHFRQLARRAPAEDEAYALETLGWLLMHALAAEVRTATSLDFWLPAPPAFAGRFPASVPGVSPQVTQLITARRLTDTSVDAAAYRTRFTTWQSGAPGRAWRLETGRDTTPGRAAAAPFYPSLFTIPGTINIAAERSQVARAWAQRLADVDAGRTSKPLTDCDNTYMARLGLTTPIPLKGLQLRTHFPSPATASTLTTLTGLAAVRTAFEAAFQAVVDLGWNDLLFETQGMGCFRGKKIPGNPAAARRMSEHSLGIAIDLNVFENGQNTTGSMDPRLVALFEAYRFRWGKGFPTPDPMHFEYAG